METDFCSYECTLGNHTGKLKFQSDVFILIVTCFVEPKSGALSAPL